MFGIHTDGTYRVENIGYSTVNLTDGYVVATRPIVREADLPTTGELFGRWTDPDTGTVYWDAVEVIEDRDTAIVAAITRGELAIWDVVANEAVPVPDAIPGVTICLADACEVDPDGRGGYCQRHTAGDAR